MARIVFFVTEMEQVCCNPARHFLQGKVLNESREFPQTDCTPIAYPRFHNEFLRQKVVLIGCPKFDDTHVYIEKFARIFQENSIRSIIVIAMEVPCRRGLPVMISKALSMAGKTIQLNVVVISPGGEILNLPHHRCDDKDAFGGTIID